MQGHDARRGPGRLWPVPEGPPGSSHQQAPPGPPPHWAVPGIRGPHPPAPGELGLLKQASAPTGPGGPPPPHSSRFQPYRVYAHPGHQFEFTIHDLNNCLYGKQEMKVIQINENPKGTPGGGGGTAGREGASSTKTSSTSAITSEDKNKPAKWCDMCQEIRFGECPKHGPLSSQRSMGPKSYAISTFPDEVGLCISTLPPAGYGVFARHFIPLGTWIGPYEGKKITVEEGLKQISQGDASFLWEIHEINSRLSHFLDASDENTSSWMRFIQCARHHGEQNLFVFQYYGSIYYRAFKDISVGAELLVWYDSKYPQYFGIPYDICDLSSYSMESRSVQAPMEVSKAPEFEGSGPHSHPGEPGGHPPHHPGAQLIGAGKVIHTLGGSRERNEIQRAPPTRHNHPPQHGHPTSSFQSPPAQPPTLSQAPSIMEGRPHHSSIYVTAGKPHPHPHPHAPLPHGHSPRPGSINPSFRREAPPSTSSSMLRSMSADDLRRRIPQHPHERPPYDREHLERLPHSTEHGMSQPLPPGLIIQHQMPPGAIPHFTSAGGFSRLPPSVMSVTPLSLEHTKIKVEEASKHSIEMKAYYERERGVPPHEHEKLARAEQERMIQMRDRVLLERGRPSIQGGPPPSERVLHEGPPPNGENWDVNVYRCKMCGQNFNQKHAFEKHHCVSDAAKPYQCGRCQLSFQDPHDLQEHMVMHNSDRPFRCGYCARSFSSSTALKGHMRMHESMNDPIAAQKELSNSKTTFIDCMKCGKRFLKSTDMNKHLATPGECVS